MILLEYNWKLKIQYGLKLFLNRFVLHLGYDSFALFLKF